jgi:hypothetical protein
MATRLLDQSLESHKGPETLLVRDAENSCLEFELVVAVSDQFGSQPHQIDSRLPVKRSRQSNDDRNALDINRYLERYIPFPGDELLTLPIAVRARNPVRPFDRSFQ